MSAMENRDEVLQMLERFTRLKQKEIPRELEDYLSFVARTGDTVYPWAAVKYFFRTKLSHVIMDFHDNTPSIADLPKCPNVDPFCYDRMKRTLLSRMESFNSAPFTIQRICELLNEPRKHYTRIDKFMRAVEKNILVVSTQEPGRRRSDSENGDSLDSIVNGDLEVNVDIEMDNEAFGIDANEMAPNAGVAALVPSVNITTPAHAEEVPPTMEPAEEQETEKQLSDDEPKLASSDNNDNELKPEAATEPEINGGDKDESATTEEDVAISADKNDYPVEPQLNSLEASEQDQPSEKPAADVIDSASDIVHDQEELEEPLPAEQPTTATESAAESLDTDRSQPLTEQSTVTPATEIESPSIDDGEPKAKMAKLSHEEPEAEEITPAEPITEEQEPSTKAESPEPIAAPVVATSTEELSESDVVSVFPSSESLESAESSSDSCLISSDEPVGSSAISIPSSTSSDSNTSVAPVQEVPAVLKTPAVQEPTVDESPNTSETTPSEPTEVAPVEEETVVKTVDLEVPKEASEQPAIAPAIPDEMEMIPAAPVAENVMATDEEEQQAHSGVADTEVPMAADATETTKPDENAMDIDESSVEPMDQ